MGVWGAKIGDSDQALDVLELCCRDKLYQKAQINRNDMGYYAYDEETICAIALVDASINGFEPKIWSNYVIEDYEYISEIQNLIKWSPRWELIDDAINRLAIIQSMESKWNSEKDRNERKEILDLLYERLGKAKCDINEFIDNRRKEILGDD